MERQRMMLSTPQELSPVMESCLKSGSEVVFTVTGNSMNPLLRHGRDQVVIRQCDPYRLQVGDLPLYRRAGGQMVLHRIVALGASTYTMCGDAQTEREYGVPCSAVMAVAVGFYRRGKYLSCDNRFYRLYVRCWTALRLQRRFLLSIDRIARRTACKLRRMFSKN